jgi:hypothetical protein
MNHELLQGIARSDYKNNLVAYLKEVQAYVADIRNGTYSNETRLATVDAIERLLIGQLKVLSGEVKPNIDDYR